MKNLEQSRAAHALTEAKPLSRAAVSKLPAMILSNGLLATAAFCDAGKEGDDNNRSGMKAALLATARFLTQQGIIGKTDSLTGLMTDLANRDSQALQLATAEALAYIAYLKRFAPKEE